VKFTDIFIRRPVLAMVVSLLILVLGVRAVGTLQVLQYPRTENAVVTVATVYYGADPDVVAGFITTPLEQAIAQANGIDYMTSTSTSGTSTIQIYLRLNYDSNKALSEINTKVNSVLNRLPPGTQQPVLTVKVGQTIDAMYLGFNSKDLAPNQITDYLVRVVQPKLQAVEGVQTAELLGAKNFALRAWLDPEKLAAFGLTAADVATQLSNNDYISGLGTTKGQMVQVMLSASTSLHTLDEFRPAGRLHRNPGGAVGQPSGRGQGRARHAGLGRLRFSGRLRRRLPRARRQHAAGSRWPHRVRRHGVREQRDRRGDPHARGSAGHRHPGRVRLPGFGALGADPDHRHPAVAGRHLHDDAGFRFLNQSSDAAGTAWWSTTPSSWSRTSIAISKRAWRPCRPRSRRPASWRARSSP
jgi:hypothetical protein